MRRRGFIVVRGVRRPPERERERSFAQKTAGFLTHPLGAAILTFLFTGVAATLFSNFLEGISKKRDLDLAAAQRAADSVKAITDLIFERSFRGMMIVSSIRRSADVEEIRERKKAYDVIYVHYNSTIQSNLFRVREMFHTTEYTDFESVFEGPLRQLLVAQDDCITSAYDGAVASDESKRKSATEILSHCPKSGGDKDIVDIWRGIQECEYAYTDSLFRIVEQNNKKAMVQDLKKVVAEVCQFPKGVATTSTEPQPNK
jgi:hypothetical protein